MQIDPHLDRFTADLQLRMAPSQTSTEQPSVSLIAAASRAADELITPGALLDHDTPPPGSADKINAAVAAGNAAIARFCTVICRCTAMIWRCTIVICHPGY